MAYPATVTNSFGMDMASNGAGQYLFEYGGNLYCCLQDAGAHAGGFIYKIHIFKSTDVGLTWTELDSSNAPDVTTGTSGGAPITFTCAVDGTTVRLLWTRMHMSGATSILDGLTKCTFDLAGPAWGVQANISSGGMDLTVNRKIVFQIIVRGTGDYIVLHSSTRASGSARVGYSTYDGSALGSAVAVPSQTGGIPYMPIGAARDSVSGVILFTYRQDGQSGNSGHLWAVGLDGSNSFGTPVEVVSSVLSDWEFQSAPVVYTKSGAAYFAFVSTRLVGGNSVIDFQEAPAALSLSFAAPVNIFTGNGATEQKVPLLTNTTAGGDAKALSLGISSTQILVCWTAWLYDEINGQYAYIYSSSTAGSGSWSAAAELFEPTTGDDHHPTCQIFALGGAFGVGALGVSFSNYVIQNFKEQPQFFALVSPALSVSVSDALALVDSLTGIYCSSLNSSGDSLALGDSLGPGPSVDVVPGSGSSSGETGSVENVFSPSCMFEFYGMERPESVEVLPVPKKFDQVLGRFDKIGKVFGFRVRLIQNGSVVLMPFSVFGDDSRTADPINAVPLYSGSFVVRPGRDNVYEIQFPKSVNTDILRLTLGPVADSFHRYDVLLKVQTSGMEGESRWMPIR